MENAIDAGATRVEVRLKEYGMDEIEVSDNGSGIAAATYASLALRPHTSKLATFAEAGVDYPVLYHVAGGDPAVAIPRAASVIAPLVER